MREITWIDNSLIWWRYYCIIAPTEKEVLFEVTFLQDVCHIPLVVQKKTAFSCILMYCFGHVSDPDTEEMII